MVVGRGTFGPVRLAWMDAAASAPLAADVLARFGDQQRRRFAALEEPAARRFLAGRRLLAALIDEAHEGADLTMGSTCERCGAEHGRPRFARVPVEVSVSYAGDIVAVAAVACAHASGVGIDIERRPSDGADSPLGGLAPLFAPGRPPSTSEWTLLEAALKADGRGVTADLSTVRIGDHASGSLPGSRAVLMPWRSDSVDAAVIPGPEGHVISAAVARPAAASRAA
ncbi:4'-phosphopantetheinyl transferase family protein [Micromonospora sp. DT81.3]|uniref:4'-phosphopantetheinyl transferase family protein n=1 Tax=Actinomycetes TaxID=1760 RepID=UPI003CEC7214